MINENIHYRLPLKLINSYTWAELIKPAKAILPVIGVHIDLRINQAKPGIKRIAGLSGYSDPRYRRIRKGIKDLISHKVITRQKEGRHYIYSLTALSFCKSGRSYFPIYKMGMILSGRWADLTPSEKSIYPVFGNKGSINDPEVLDSEFHAIGDIYKIKKYIKWSGISFRSFKRTLKSLNHKDLIEILEEDEEENYYRYGVYAPK